jgi:glutamine amidotransferase
MNKTISIVDYGHGNLGSILNMLKKLGSTALLVSSADTLDKSDKIILPGVGSFYSGIKALEEKGFRKIIKKKAMVDRVPILGICLGMQMLGQSSEEGFGHGLNIISGRCRRFPACSDLRFKIPHMGWAVVSPSKNAFLFEGIDQVPRFYFVHSYYFECDRKEDIAATAMHGIEFVAAVQCENIFGVQFHPEKSHRFGMNLLRNFMRL